MSGKPIWWFGVANAVSRALGTALDWPDAQEHAQKVREWGIKVAPYRITPQNQLDVKADPL